MEKMNRPYLKNSLRYFVQTVLYYVCLLVIGLIFTIGGVICWLTSVFLPKKEAVIWSRAITRVAFYHYLSLCSVLGLMQIDTKALEQLNGRNGLVIAPNHPSMIDVVLIMSRLKNCTCIAKDSLIKHLIFGVSARANQYISNGDLTSMIKQAVCAIDSGAHVLVFPEGTRTVFEHGSCINPLGGSAVLIAKRAKSRIQMVYVHTNSRFLGRGWPPLRRPNFPIVYRVVLGDQLVPATDLSFNLLAMQTAFEANLEYVN
jgi:1-acyl-sn-glycerol-3-phosphate acyltransferase